MKSRQSLLWLGAPALVAAMITQAALGEPMQQHQQTQQMDQDKMHQMDQDKMQQTKGADEQDCAGIEGMDRSKIDMNDPAVQEKMQKCMQMMHSDTMMGSDKMMGGEMPGGGESSQTGG